MATSSRDLKSFLFSAVNISSILVILGERTESNRRVYAAWPQERPVLSGVEPAEGWLSFHELYASKVFGGNTTENYVMQFNLWNTLQSNNDLVKDILDELFDQPPVDQGGYPISDDWVVLLSQRTYSNEQYDETNKLHRKICNYTFMTTKVPYRVGP